MKKLVIFDLDGTLLNTIADLAQSTNHALEALGYPTHEEAAYKFMVGNGINKLFERALPEGEKTEENVLKVRSHFVPYYDQHNADKSRSRLQSRQVQLAVASNKYQSATEKLVAHYFPTIRFAAVYGQREGIATKPDPTIVFDILKQTSIAPDLRRRFGCRHADGPQCPYHRLWCHVGVPSAHRIGGLLSETYCRHDRSHRKHRFSLSQSYNTPLTSRNMLSNIFSGRIFLKSTHITKIPTLKTNIPHTLVYNLIHLQRCINSVFDHTK